MRGRGVVFLAALVAACDGGFFENTDPDEPSDLTYQLIPSGDPEAPAGIVLQWMPPRSGRAVTYDVYSRASTRDDFGLRATTTSPSFHDAGYPQLQYYVEALDEDDQAMGATDVVEVDERNRLPAPNALTSITLNEAVQLRWDQNAYLASPQGFDFYRVYSTTWSAAGGCDGAAWSLEGTTVSDGFLSRNLANGQTRCFAVSAISRDGHESIWSNVRQDTPRYDARSIVLDASDVRPSTSGFMFSDVVVGQYGVIVSNSYSGRDVVLERGSDGALWFRAVANTTANTQVTQFGLTPVSELTSIDRAPSTGYTDAVRVQAGFGYVFRTQIFATVMYSAIRVVHVAPDYVLFDFAYQTQPNNPELLRATP